ncbi:MAG: hypothetical protein P8J79_06045 [Halioglobus sp.]|nr:hypothetical protein [Halioglobus sp.]
MEFLKQQCTLTLREGLQELYLNNPEVAATSNHKGKTFQDHDLTHVIFGCDTSISGEIALKPWILFGTTISLRELKDYAADEDVQRLNKEGETLLGGPLLASLKAVFIFLPQFFTTWLFRVRKMHQKWPHSSVTADMFDTKIAVLRSAYGIKVLPIKSQ